MQLATSSRTHMNIPHSFECCRQIAQRRGEGDAADWPLSPFVVTSLSCLHRKYRQFEYQRLMARRVNWQALAIHFYVNLVFKAAARWLVKPIRDFVRANRCSLMYKTKYSCHIHQLMSPLDNRLSASLKRASNINTLSSRTAVMAEGCGNGVRKPPNWSKPILHTPQPLGLSLHPAAAAQPSQCTVRRTIDNRPVNERKSIDLTRFIRIGSFFSPAKCKRGPPRTRRPVRSASDVALRAAALATRRSATQRRVDVRDGVICRITAAQSARDRWRRNGGGDAVVREASCWIRDAAIAGRAARTCSARCLLLRHVTWSQVVAGLGTLICYLIRTVNLLNCSCMWQRPVPRQGSGASWSKRRPFQRDVYEFRFGDLVSRIRSLT